MSSTADLGDYIEKCHFQGFAHLPRDGVFDQGITHLRPLLERNRTNRILLYPGSFNPPHRAHEALLNQAFASSQDLNVIAAIVILLDDESVERKCRGSLVLTKDQRVRLWRGDYGVHDWLWVYDRSVEEWHSFRRRLADAVSQDGFDIGFTALCGPDHVRRSARLPWGTWDCNEIIVGNAGRIADFTTLRGTLLPLEDCEKWETVSEDEEQAYQRAMRRTAWFAGAAFLLAPDTMAETLQKGKNPA